MTKQQVDPTTGRVIPTREQIARDLLKLPIVNKPLSFDMDELVKYVMQQISQNYQSNVNLGISIGRKEMVAAMESVIGEDEHLPRSIAPKQFEWARNKLRAEQRQRLKAMVGVLEKGGLDKSSEVAK